MRQIGSILVGAVLASLCMGSSETEMARVKSPDGHAVATVTVKTQRGMWLPGPEPPKVKGQWVRIAVTVDGKQKYDSGFEDVGVYQPCNFAYDLGWSPDSGHVAIRAISTLRVVGRDGRSQPFDVTKDNSLVSSFKWYGNRQIIVVAKKVAEPLGMFGYPKHYHGYLTKSLNVKVYRIDLDAGISERFAADVKEPTFMFRSIGFLNQEIAPGTNRVAFSDGNAISVYDDSLGRVVATAPVNGSIEGTWWDTNDKLIIGIALLSGEKHFSILDVKTGKVEDGSSTYLPIWDSEWNNEGWFLRRK
jgi:hypothetical protein